jgi:hypothetical protein
VAADQAVQKAMQEGYTFCAWQVDLVHFGGLVWPASAREVLRTDLLPPGLSGIPRITEDQST